jgi:hypothetical protein
MRTVKSFNPSRRLAALGLAGHGVRMDGRGVLGARCCWGDGGAAAPVAGAAERQPATEENSAKITT